MPGREVEIRETAGGSLRELGPLLFVFFSFEDIIELGRRLGALALRAGFEEDLLVDDF